ncbi:MAG: ABC-F family ATP-binding cassette domain-containing protein [Candidatus Coatesbacteria bacterium]|nr:ABC-F family ATP-binding cassette domain-containing protein [Candidatus Coatesbacteria bacterium]
MFALNNISLRFVDRKILDNVSWHVSDGERVGVVGANGSGKSTLLKIIAGLQEPDSGCVESPKNSTFGYLPQQIYEALRLTVWDEAMEVFADVIELRHEMQRLEHEITAAADEIEDGDSLLERYGAVQHRFEQLDGFEVESKVGTVLHGLGFQKSDFHRPSAEFSGGWQMRIALAKVLLQQPDILLLDEPTNYLDLEARQWLEQYLIDYEGIVVIVSHDRYFLDKMVTRLVEVGFGKLEHYACNYSKYEVERVERRELLEKKYRHQQEHIAHVQAFIDKFRYKASKASSVQSRVKYLEKIELIELPPETKKLRFEFPQPERGGKEVVSIKNLKKAYGDNTVFENLDLTIGRNERVCLVGVNGAGKTTLLKMIAGVEPFDTGEIKLGHNIKLDYFSQDQDTDLTPDATVLEEMESVTPIEMISRLRGILGNFLFSGDDVLKRVKVLSGGERARLVLAKMMFRRANLLVLDEPTNHLDIAAKQVFEDTLHRYTGTVILVSHDRRLMNNVATRILEVENGEITEYLGNYDDYLYRKRQEETRPTEPRAQAVDVDVRPTIPQVEEGPHPQSKEGRRLKQLANEEKQRRERELADLKDQAAELEAEIAATEAKLAELKSVLPESDDEQLSPKFRAARQENKRLSKRLPKLYQMWESLLKQEHTLRGHHRR